MLTVLRCVIGFIYFGCITSVVFALIHFTPLRQWSWKRWFNLMLVAEGFGVTGRITLYALFLVQDGVQHNTFTVAGALTSLAFCLLAVVARSGLYILLVWFFSSWTNSDLVLEDKPNSLARWAALYSWVTAVFLLYSIVNEYLPAL